ncbi:MAG TPA: hypothetical protein VEY67_03935, partial [Candidatus Dormibacteraeota bacterium]|nr:hypothetical protein [Candidatus Dormibacteraeota bacterium]
GLTDAEEARAAEIEAGLVEQERAAEATRRRGRDRAASASELDLSSRGRVRGSIAFRYADEYGYVSRDLRQIAVLAAVLLAILFTLYFLIEVAGVIAV